MGGDVLGVKTFGLGWPGHGQYGVAHGRHGFTRTALVAPVLISKVGQRQPGELRPVLRKQYQSFWITIWKRAEQDRVDHAEHGGIGANAQCQRKHSYHHKPRTILQSSKRITEIHRQGIPRWAPGYTFTPIL